MECIVFCCFNFLQNWNYYFHGHKLVNKKRAGKCMPSCWSTICVIANKMVFRLCLYYAIDPVLRFNWLRLLVCVVVGILLCLCFCWLCPYASRLFSVSYECVTEIFRTKTSDHKRVIKSYLYSWLNKTTDYEWVIESFTEPVHLKNTWTKQVIISHWIIHSADLLKNRLIYEQNKWFILSESLNHSCNWFV